MRELYLAIGLTLGLILIGVSMSEPEQKINLNNNIIITPQSLNYSTPLALISSIIHTRRIIDITLTSELNTLEIGGMSEFPPSIAPIVNTLRYATQYDTIVFHLTGPGGNVEIFNYLIANVKKSKAYIIMKVESNASSGMAYFATTGNELHMDHNAYLMFHSVNALGYDCLAEEGNNRGVANSIHCLNLSAATLHQNYEFLSHIPFLTKEEVVAIFKGDDVYITADQYHQRTGQ